MPLFFMELKALSCSRCGGIISEKNLNEPVIKCDYCGCNYILSGNILNDDRALVPIPENMRIDNRDGRFTLTYNWKSVIGIVLIIFGGFFFFFSMIWTLTATVSGGGGFATFGLFFIFMSFCLIYMGIAYRINKTIIKIENSILSIKFAPLIWPGEILINVTEILQLYVQKKEYQNKKNTTYTYNIVALQKDNRSTTLLKMITEPDIAKCIEQQIEKYLGIKDIPIAGEYKV
jgi:hypothetical protein